MSVLNNFSIPNISGEDLSDSRKVKAILDSLRILDENLRYAMYNLDPEDNFSESALKTYRGLISRAEKIGEDGKEYTTLIEQNAEAIRLEAQRAINQEIELAAALSVTAEGLESKVEKDGIISAINQSAETVSIKANKIDLNGAVTANNYFKINTDGSVETSAITIGGKNSKINIQTSSTTYDVIALNYTDASHTLLAGMKPGEIRAEYDSLVASMTGSDGFVYYSDDGAVDAQYGQNAYTKGYGDFRGGVYIGSKAGIATRYGNAVLIQDYGNGHVACNAAGGNLYLGMKNTSNVIVNNALRFQVGTIDDGGTDVDHSIECEGDIVCGGNMACGGTKYRVVKTSKGRVGMNAYETAEPYFGDMGSGTIDSEGYAKVNIDSLFSETVSVEKYIVFLQGSNVRVIEKEREYFVVKGEPGTEFDWEIKAKQKGYEKNRMERV